MKKLYLTLLISILYVNIQLHSQVNSGGQAKLNVVKEVKNLLGNSPKSENSEQSGIIISNLKNSPKGEVDLKFWPEDFNEQEKNSPDPNGNDDIYIIYSILDALKKAKNGTLLSISPSPNPISNGTVTISPFIVEMTDGKSKNNGRFLTFVQYPYTLTNSFSIDKNNTEDYALFFSTTYGRVSKIIVDKLVINEAEINESSNFQKMFAGNPEMENEEGFVLFITNTKTDTGEFLEASFTEKGSNDIKLKIIIPTNNKAFVEKLFELSDQSKEYELKLNPTNEKPKNNDTPYLLYNVWGDVVSMESLSGRILSFTQNYDNYNTLCGNTDHFKTAQNNNSNLSSWLISGPPIQEAEGKGTKRTTSQAQTKPELL